MGVQKRVGILFLVWGFIEYCGGKILKNYNPLDPFVLNKTFGHELYQSGACP